LTFEQTKECLEDFDAAISLAPTYPYTYVNRSRVLAGLGKTEEAIADFKRALQVAPSDWDGRSDTIRRLSELRKQ
jgi:tetratricopeptide (TPR) repeat protein